MPPNKILRKNFSKKLNFFTEDDIPVGQVIRKKYGKNIFSLHPYNQ
jgi:hypothetical protein